MNFKKQKVVVIGLGYIGLPTSALLATKGHQVVGVDNNRTVVETINAGKIHIVEPDLDILVRSALNSGNLKISCTLEEADIFIIAVPTPFMNSDKNIKVADVSFVEVATKSIAPYLKPGNLIILESTSPVGTTERICKIVQELRFDLSFDTKVLKTEPVYLAHCPERVMPGKLIRELVDNDRIVGGINTISAEKARDLYKTMCSGNIILTDSKTAE